MTLVIGVIVIVEITCQLPVAVAVVPLTNSDRGEGSSMRPPDDFSSDNKECRASDNLPVSVECVSERDLAKLLSFTLTKTAKCSGRGGGGGFIKINEIALRILCLDCACPTLLALYEICKIAVRF